MIIVCLGDSLTEGDYGVFGKRGIANVHSENYPYFLSNILGAKTRNFGKCGYTATSYLEYYKSGAVDLSGADIILIMLGTNGGLDPDAETDGNRDYRELCALCEKDAPSARIILCTPPHATSNPEFANCGYAAQVENAVKFVRAFAAEKELPVLETALCPDFTEENERLYQSYDGLHFVEPGYRKLAEYIAEQLKSMGAVK